MSRSLAAYQQAEQGLLLSQKVSLLGQQDGLLTAHLGLELQQVTIPLDEFLLHCPLLPVPPPSDQRRTIEA